MPVTCHALNTFTYPASIFVIKLPLFTQFNVCGANDPITADPNTNNGNKHVNCDRIRSIFGNDSMAGVDDSSEDVDENAIILRRLLDCCLQL